MSRNQYFEHDDRIDNRNSSRSIGRSRKFNNRFGGRGGYSGGRARFEDHDGDVDMSGPGNSWGNERRFNPYKPQHHQGKRRKDKNRNRIGKHLARSNNDADGSWFKITIPFGKKMGRQFILKALTSNCKTPFVPFNFQFDGNCAVFFVNDYNSAVNIREVNRKVTNQEGFKMGVMMSRCPPPVSTMDEEIAEKIKACMSNHYNVSTHHLNLSKFHYDTDLRAQGLYVPLHKPIILSAVVRIIKEHIPELECLDLSQNRLFSLESFSALVPVCKQLTVLTLENNKIKSVNELNHIKGMNISDLVLDGNPLCDDFKEKATYISSIRDRLPKLVRLDGHELPAPIGFDLGTEAVPASKGSYFIAEDVKGLVIQFLEQYYTIYDTEDRSQLLNAYHDQATFSLSICRLSQKNSNQGLQQYTSENRNLLRITDHSQRFKLLKQGRLSVVSALSELPQTQHDPNSFTVDIFHVSPGLMTFVVSGVFKEVGLDINNPPLRTFHRTFVVVAQGAGLVITNETLFIANATPEQIKAFKFPAPTPSPSPAPSTGDKSPNEKQQLAIEFAKQTGMNLDFAAKCLEENEWDFQRSAIVFNELKNLGRIPPAAFVAK